MRLKLFDEVVKNSRHTHSIPTSVSNDGKLTTSETVVSTVVTKMQNFLNMISIIRIPYTHAVTNHQHRLDDLAFILFILLHSSGFMYVLEILSKLSLLCKHCTSNMN